MQNIQITKHSLRNQPINPFYQRVKEAQKHSAGIAQRFPRAQLDIAHGGGKQAENHRQRQCEKIGGNIHVKLSEFFH